MRLRAVLGWIACRLGRHQWRFKLVNLEGHKVFVCRRCRLMRQDGWTMGYDRPDGE